MRKRMRLAALALTVAAALAGCGSKSAETTEGQSEEKEWVYVPQFIELEDEDASLYNACVAGDYLYYETGDYNEATEEYVETIWKYSLTDGSVSDMKIPLNQSTSGEEGSYSGENINYFKALEDGGIAVVLNCYNSDDQGNYESYRTFAKFDADGNEVFRCELNSLFGEDAEDIYISKLIVDGQGRFYLFTDETDILLFDADGNSCGKADMSGVSDWIDCAGVAKDGNVYASTYRWDGTSGGYVLYEVDFDKKAPGASYENFLNGSNTDFAPGIDGDLLVQDGTTVYEYSFQTQQKSALFDWLDSDINGSYVSYLGTLSDGRLLALTNDWSTDENEVVLLTKTPGSQVAQKQQIVVGTLAGASSLQAAAVQFNKNNDTYHVTIKQYIDYDNWGDTSYSDAVTKLNNDITSNSCPDIIDLEDINVEQLADKGVFEDLNPYLESSKVLSRDDFLENLLDSYTYDGVLVSIPRSFTLQTVIGRASDVGTEMGWTIEELMAYADQHPEAAIFDSTTQASVLQYSLMYNENVFIDWENGDCHFDSDEFKQVLEFANRFPEDWEWSDDDASEPTKIQNGEVLLSNAYIYDFEQIQLYNEMFGGDVTCIGYPTSDGSAGCALMASGVYAITTKSGVKEGAWEFLEYLLANTDTDDPYFWGFPSNKNALDEMIEEATKVEYVLDDVGNQILDENGDPVTYGGGSGIGYQDGWEYTFHIPTQEEVDQTLALMEVARPVTSGTDEVYSIISEEAEAYFKGQKTVDEVADIIQSRVKIYVSENS